MTTLRILSVNISGTKGTVKHPLPSVTLTGHGVEGDAHSGPWNRQVSLLGIESIRKFEAEAGRSIAFGEFAENLTTEGIELWRCQPLDRFEGEGFTLEVTQIGKACHGSSCAIFNEVGNCVMPKEGVFARVIDAGPAVPNPQSRIPYPGSPIPDPVSRILDPVSRIPLISHPVSLYPGLMLTYKPKIYTAAIITLSDRAFAGEYEDRSGPRIRELLEEHLATGSDPGSPPSSHVLRPTSHVPRPSSHVPRPSSHVLRPTSHVLRPSSHLPRLTSHITLLPDHPGMLRQALTDSIAAGTDFIFTTGGTGIGPRDITPEVVRPLLDKEIPGIMEMIRMKYGETKPNALLSRAVAGVAGHSLVFTLPGSVNAVGEYLDEILKSLMHMVYMVHGLDVH